MQSVVHVGFCGAWQLGVANTQCQLWTEGVCQMR